MLWKKKKRYNVKHPRFYVGVGMFAITVGIAMNLWFTILPGNLVLIESTLLLLLGSALVAKYY
jgi:hypothetical protein